jgi:hypothetical protein
MTTTFNNEHPGIAPGLLADHLELAQSPAYELIIFGGSSLIVRDMLTKLGHESVAAHL